MYVHVERDLDGCTDAERWDEKGTKRNMLVKEKQNAKSKGKYIGSERVLSTSIVYI